MATCPGCGMSSRVEAGVLVLEEVVVTRALGTFSVSGEQMKFSADVRDRLRCLACGWAVLGRIEGDHFVADG